MGVTGLWARACPVLMGVMGSYASLKNCALCVKGDTGYREGSRVFRVSGSRDRDGDRKGDGDGDGGVDEWDVEGRASKVCVLSVAELSTPLRDQYDSGKRHIYVRLRCNVSHCLYCSKVILVG